MFASAEYELLDFGAGRKLERFGQHVIDRPCPAADDSPPRNPALWSQAEVRYERDAGERGQWSPNLPPERPWQVRYGNLTFALKPAEQGQVGVFPEQAANWDWIAAQVRAADGDVKLLNLFAYTGASTLAAAEAGASVVHVDAAANAVNWARQNAELSNLAKAPTRWIVEDALKFVRRELKRGNSYDAIVLDPPAYGHGPKGEIWKLEEHLDEMLKLCWELVQGQCRFLLLSCHSGSLAFHRELLSAMLEAAPQLGREGKIAAEDLHLASRAGGSLQSGAAVRWSCAG